MRAAAPRISVPADRDARVGATENLNLLLPAGWAVPGAALCKAARCVHYADRNILEYLSHLSHIYFIVPGESVALYSVVSRIQASLQNGCHHGERQGAALLRVLLLLPGDQHQPPQHLDRWRGPSASSAFRFLATSAPSAVASAALFITCSFFSSSLYFWLDLLTSRDLVISTLVTLHCILSGSLKQSQFPLNVSASQVVVQLVVQASLQVDFRPLQCTGRQQRLCLKCARPPGRQD